MKILNSQEWLAQVSAKRAKTSYRAMYSSWAGGIVTDPALMLIPIDDHMVHRGDGVFEAMRVVNGAGFDFDAHLARLQISAEKISLKLPMTLSEIKSVCVATVKASDLKDAAIRVFVGRGPGSFSPNPYESTGSQLYVIATEFRAIPEDIYQKGARAVFSKVPQKDGFFSQIKSCNYLPNVLMKKEAVDAGVDFSIGCSASGVLLEGPTENFAIVNKKGEFVVPKFDYTLKGTTLMALVESLAKKPMSELKSCEFHDLRADDIFAASEMFMIGTTLEVLSVVEVSGRKIGTGKPGPCAALLRQRLRSEMRDNPQRRTPL